MKRHAPTCEVSSLQGPHYGRSVCAVTLGLKKRYAAYVSLHPLQASGIDVFGLLLDDDKHVVFPHIFEFLCCFLKSKHQPADSGRQRAIGGMYESVSCKTNCF